MVDQLSARWLEGPNRSAIATPNIDRLQRMGVTFSNTITSNPVCCPARATLATGLTTRGHGVLQNGYMLDPALPTYMGLLQQAGWRTGAFGKVHFHPHFAGVHPDYRPYGFDETAITEDPRAGDWLDWIMAEHPAHVEAALAQIWCCDIPELKAYGPDRIDLSEKIKRIRSDFQWATPEFPDDDARHFTLRYPEHLSQTAWITQNAVRFLRDTPADTPLHAHISYVQPHSPSCPPPEYMALVDRDKLTAPVPVEWDKDPLRPACFERLGAVRADRTEDPRIGRHYYFADVAHLDTQLGLVLDALEECGRIDRTLFLFLSDHGEMLLDHGITGKGEFHYDACIRVPLVLAGPELQADATCDALVQLEDIFPTVLDAVGLPAPQPNVMGPYLHETPPATHGRSLLPLARGEEVADWRDAAYSESYDNITSCSPAHWARTVRTARYRYTLYPGGQGEQLFDLHEDPDEQVNMAWDPARLGVAREMRDRLMEAIILQDWPHPPRGRFALGVH